MSSGALIEARQPPRFEVLVSVAVNLTTAMLLVDYALHGLTTPTPWAGVLAARLSRPVRGRFDEVRAFLGHGAVVRDFLCGTVGPARAAGADLASPSGGPPLLGDTAWNPDKREACRDRGTP